MMKRKTIFVRKLHFQNFQIHLSKEREREKVRKRNSSDLRLPFFMVREGGTSKNLDIILAIILFKF